MHREIEKMGRAKQFKFTEAQLHDMKVFREEKGFTWVQLGSKYNCSSETVRRALQEYYVMLTKLAAKASPKFIQTDKHGRPHPQGDYLTETSQVLTATAPAVEIHHGVTKENPAGEARVRFQETMAKGARALEECAKILATLDSTQRRATIRYLTEIWK